MSMIHPSLWRIRRRPLRAKPGAARPKRSRLRPINRERLARVHERQFGPPERRAWIASLPCATCGRKATKYEPSFNSHVGRSRGAGGGPDDVIPQCFSCHVAFHEGIETFCARRNSTVEHLHALADRYAAAWREVEAARVEGPP